MKTISESILKKAGVGIWPRIKEWYDNLSNSDKSLYEIKEDDPLINFVGKQLVIDKNFGKTYPSSINFNTATNVSFEFPDLKTISQWPHRVLDSIYIYSWPNGALTGIPAIDGKDSSVTVDGCSLITSLNGLDGVGEIDTLTISSLGRLTSLEGLPTRIHSLIIKDCPKLTDLSLLADRHFDSLTISGCTTLTSLKGCPDVVGGNFTLVKNTNLTSLEGMPRVVKGTLTIYQNGRPFSKDDVEARCKARRLRIV